MQLDLQIIDDAAGTNRAFETALRSHSVRLGCFGTISHAPTVDPSVDVCVLFIEGDDPQYDPDLDLYIRRGKHVFVVIEKADDAVRLRPPLSERNAFVRERYGKKHWPHALSDEVLARAWLRRPERKLFISYRRADSADVARQLHDRLSALGYNVFLDEVSIARSVDIRGTLTWAINDVDAVILLASPQIDKSQWVLDEIAFANARSIAVIGVCWAGSPLAPPLGPLAPDQCVDIDKPDNGNLLSDDQLEAVLGKVFEHRAHAIKTRLDHLVPIVKQRAARMHWNVSSLRGLGDLELTHPRGTAFVRVFPHRPSGDELYDAVRWARRQFPRLTMTICSYAECDQTHPSVQAMTWLFEDGHRPSCALWRYLGTIP